jgi:hypothetical protein
MAANAGVPMRHFIETHVDLGDDMEVKLVNYVKKLLGETEPSPTPGDGQPVATTTPTATNAAVKAGLEQIAMQNGLPVMPEVRMGDRVKKQELEKLMRAYLTAHYSKPI